MGLSFLEVLSKLCLQEKAVKALMRCVEEIDGNQGAQIRLDIDADPEGICHTAALLLGVREGKEADQAQAQGNETILKILTIQIKL